jgi:hypothetical protein
MRQLAVSFELHDLQAVHMTRHRPEPRRSAAGRYYRDRDQAAIERDPP